MSGIDLQIFIFIFVVSVIVPRTGTPQNNHIFFFFAFQAEFRC